MIERAYIHVGGPPGGGKTTLVEAALRGIDRMWLAARCVRDESLRRARQSSLRDHPELRRYRRAGASGASLFKFPGEEEADGFFETNLMSDYSEAVVIEGDNPLGFVDLSVYVAPPLRAGASLFIRRRRDRAKEQREKLDAMEKALRRPEGVVEVLGALMGRDLAAVAGGHEAILTRTRAQLLDAIEQTRKAPPPKPTRHWAIAEGYEGIDAAQMVVVNVRGETERREGERLVTEVHALRTRRPVVDDILGTHGARTPITAVVADLSDAKDAGLKKALARVRRAVGSRR